MIRRPPRSTLCPDTTLFRSRRVSVTAKGVNGPVEVGEVEGALEVSGVNGRAELVQAGGRAEVSGVNGNVVLRVDRKSTRLNSSHANISYAVFCLKKKNILIYFLTHLTSCASSPIHFSMPYMNLSITPLLMIYHHFLPP